MRLHRIALLVALVSIVALSVATAQQAQQPPQSQGQQPPPSWQQGRPAEMGNSPLAPNPPKLTPTPGKDIPVSSIKLPSGFSIELWAEGLPNARSMTLGKNGTVYVGTRLVGNVYAVTDKNGRREVKTIAKDLHRPNGVVYKDGTLYVAELSRVIRFDGIDDKLDSPPPPAVVYDKLPKDEPHGWKFMALGPDDKLYFNIGAPCNICMPPDTHAKIVRLSRDGSRLEVYASGVRNSVGMDWHPVTKELWFTENGRDWLGEDSPNDELNRASQPGMHFGYPYCHSGETLDPEHGKGKQCNDYSPPVVKLGPHVAALGMRFYTGSMFPAEYKNRAFIALHGSWNRTEKTGYKIMQVTVPANGAPKYETFAEGWLQGDKFWGRPVDLLVMPDGALLISDDYAGAIYRVSYRK